VVNRRIDSPAPVPLPVTKATPREARGLLAGDADLTIAGGVEVMTRVPMGSSYTQGPGVPFGPRMLKRYDNGLVHQGISADLVAQKWELSREELDAFSLESHCRGARAIAEGRFSSQVVPVEVKNEDGTTTIFDRDEGIRTDTSLDRRADLLDSAVRAAALSLENARLHAALLDQLQQLAQSRTRIVEAGLAERRRVERDLHDGAQQRLVSLAMNLGMARERFEAEPEPVRHALAAAHDEAVLALTELREFIRGLHPAVLNDRGLDAALSGLAARAPLPVRLQVDVPRPETLARPCRGDRS